MKRLLRHENLLLAAIFILATVILYGYYWFFSGYKLQLLYQNWDGPSYVVIAKSFYDPVVIRTVNTLPVNEAFFAAHFPLYPLSIRLFSFLGYFRSMLFTSLLASLLFIFTFNRLVKLVYPKINSLILSVPLIFLTPRWFIVSHVGSSEPLFLLLLTLSLISFRKNKLIRSAVFAALAQLTRSQGILFFVGLCFYYLWLFIKKRKSFSVCFREILPFFLVPLSLLAVFTLYYFRYGDFFAFFKSIQDIHHLQWPPLLIFSSYLSSSSTNVWREILVYYYLFYLFTVIELFRKKMTDFAFIALAFFLPLPFLVHPDLSRYSLSLLPLAFIAFKPVFESKTLRWALLLALPAIFSFAVNFINFNLST